MAIALYSALLLFRSLSKVVSAVWLLTRQTCTYSSVTYYQKVGAWNSMRKLQPHHSCTRLTSWLASQEFLLVVSRTGFAIFVGKSAFGKQTFCSGGLFKVPGLLMLSSSCIYLSSISGAQEPYFHNESHKLEDSIFDKAFALNLIS